MITPLDIQNIEFSKAVRGYKEEEVDEFLDQLTKDLEQVLAERDALLLVKDELTAQLAEANTKVVNYQQQEGAVLTTLEAAKALMNDISTSAEKRAQILVMNAELDAQNIRRQAEESLGVLKDEETRLIQRVSNFKARYKSLLEGELEKFDDFSDELVGIPTSPSVVKFEKKAEPAAAPAPAPVTADTVDLEKTITNFRGEL
ncbi:MAG: DivIVA domain-containing protein [Clostridia bacterium]|nr:DivIVA domain-containing protein [Clostridia bacterium]